MSFELKSLSFKYALHVNCLQSLAIIKKHLWLCKHDLKQHCDKKIAPQRSNHGINMKPSQKFK